MTYYKVTNTIENFISGVFQSKDLDYFENLFKDLPHLVIEEISAAEYLKECK